MHGTSSCRMDVPATTFRLFSRVVIVWEVCNGEGLYVGEFDFLMFLDWNSRRFFSRVVTVCGIFNGVLFPVLLQPTSLRKQMRSSEDDLLCPRASPSLLPLLFSGLGIHLRSLNKLNASDGSFKLSGNISGPDVYTVKVYRPKLMDKRCEKNLKNYLMP
ncbi:hypothetical protein KY289_003099 [Solanum tuberosum]|nr:hypothetical protein KY289_003099 [Solanum tuberosum]